MTLLHTARTAAKHRGKSLTDICGELDQLTCNFTELAIAYTTQQTQLDEAGIELSGLRLDKDRLTELLDKRNGQVIRQAADLARLRQAVIDARPKITFATAPRIPPFAPMESIPMDAGEPLPVGKWLPFPPDADDDTTVSIPLADLLCAGVTPTLADRFDAGARKVTISGGDYTR